MDTVSCNTIVFVR